MVHRAPRSLVWLDQRERRAAHGTLHAERAEHRARERRLAAAQLAGQRDEPAAIARRISEIQQAREASQPIRTRTGGSTFANPTDPKAKGARAWQLIDAAGCRGLRIGGAQVSCQHCNFLINTGSATGTEIEALGEEVRRRVLETTGVELEWEIRRIGVAVGRGSR